MKRALVLFAAAAAIGGAGFVWGYFAHRNHIFPYALLRRGAAPQPVHEPAGASPQVSELLSLPYIGAMKADDPRARGVVERREGAHHGLNFYASPAGGQNRAYLIDMDGRVRHAWRFPREPLPVEAPHWVHSELLPNGDVVSVLEDVGLFRANVRSNVIARLDLPVHHDFAVSGDEIHALIHRPVRVPAIHPDVPVLVDFVAVVARDGTVVRETSLLEPLLRSPYRTIVPRLQHKTLPPETRHINLLHTNHIELADGSLARLGPLYARGNLLVAFRNLNAVAILDGRSFDVLWLWGPSNLTAPHHPAFLENGRVLLFNNGLRESEVIEVDPRTNEVHWRYAAGRRFFSASRGGNQRLANGNTLITESDRGSVFEVTPRGEVVWRFFNPDVNAKGERAVIWRMQRHDEAALPFLRPKR